MTPGISELAEVVGLAAVLGILARLLRQPLMVAYLAVGVAIGGLGLLEGVDLESMRLFADLGIMFLLFLVGLEINWTSLKQVGFVSSVIGLGQIVFTALIGYWIVRSLGFASISSFYIAVALTFSSTIIIVKLLSRNPSLSKKIVRAETVEEAQMLYRAGADYVIFPHLTTGNYLGHRIATESDLAFLNDLRGRDLAALGK